MKTTCHECGGRQMSDQRVDVVAKAIHAWECSHDNIDGTWKEASDSLKEYLRDLARAILAAIE